MAIYCMILFMFCVLCPTRGVRSKEGLNQKGIIIEDVILSCGVKADGRAHRPGSQMRRKSHHQRSRVEASAHMGRPAEIDFKN